MKFRAVWVQIAIVSLALVDVAGAEHPVPSALGQLVAEGGSVDGLPVPAGTTILAGSVVGAWQRPTTVRLATGHALQVERNSSALLERGSPGEILVRVETGTVSYLGMEGAVSTLPPSATVVFSRQSAAQPLASEQTGVVAVVARAGGLERAEAGRKRVPVNDASRVQPTRELLLRTSPARTQPRPERFVQEVACGIESVRDNVVTLTEDLTFTHQPEDLVIQASRLPQSQVATRLKRSIERGSDRLEVEDSKKVNPLERIVLQSPDRRLREVACVRYTDEDLTQDADAVDVQSLVKIRAPLENGFAVGSEILQGRRFESERVVTTLSQNASEGKRTLEVVEPAAVDPFQQVLIRTVDGSLFEAYCVYHIKDGRVTLAEDLDHDYPAGSEVIQGRSSQELVAKGVALQRTANCCCCCGSGLVPGAVVLARHIHPIWYLIGGGAAAGGVAGLVGGGGGGGSTPGGGGPLPPPASQITP